MDLIFLHYKCFIYFYYSDALKGSFEFSLMLPQTVVCCIFSPMLHIFRRHSSSRCLYLHSAESLLWPGDFLTPVIYYPLHPATWRESPPPQFLEMGGHFNSLSLKEGHKTWNAQEGSHRSKDICTAGFPFLSFPPPLFPTPSLSDKVEEGWWSKWIRMSGGLCVWAHVCVCVLWES